MQMTQLIRTLGRNDVKVIGRDSFLLFMFGFIGVITAVLRFGLPAFNNFLINNGILPSGSLATTLADHYPVLVAYMAIYTGGLLIGTIFGFVLIDEKDQQTLRAMLITPVPLNSYVLYRVGLPAILSLLITFGMVQGIGLGLVPAWQLLLLSLVGSLTAPIIALFFATFADNKVEAFAYGKFVGIFGWTILIGWFLPEPYQWLMGLFPPFWVSKAYWLMLEGGSWWGLSLLLGAVLQLGMVWVLLRLFRRAVYR